MNGETAQKSGIVMSARKALHDGEEIKYCLDSYVLSNKLLEQLRYNLMYIVNESWNKECN